MTWQEIKSLPSVADLAKRQQDQIDAHKAAGTYTHETLLSLCAERDAVVARETVVRHDYDGNEVRETIWGNAQQRFQREASFRRAGKAA